MNITITVYCRYVYKVTYTTWYNIFGFMCFVGVTLHPHVTTKKKQKNLKHWPKCVYLYPTLPCFDREACIYLYPTLLTWWPCFSFWDLNIQTCRTNFVSGNATLPVGAAAYTYSYSRFGRGVDANLTCFRCYGNESQLLNCTHHMTSSCSRDYTAGLLCYAWRYCVRFVHTITINHPFMQVADIWLYRFL